MSKAIMVNITKKELDSMMNQLGLKSRRELSEFLDVAPHTIGWWIANNKMPLFRLNILKSKLTKNSSDFNFCPCCGYKLRGNA